MRPRCRVVVLVSGNGRNLQALIDACSRQQIRADLVGVISNRADAPALARAAQAGIACFAMEHQNFSDREAFDRALLETIQKLNPDIVVLAGFMRILGKAFVAALSGKMINIHPSLLPRHRGLHTHRRALEDGDTEHGATVHLVSEDLDGGPLIIQGRVSVSEEDDATSLAERVMTEVELKILPQALAWIATGELQLGHKAIEFRGQKLTKALQLEDLTETFQ